MSEALAVSGVTKTFGAVKAVDGVSAAFALGEIAFVCGENGAGKSTLLRIAAGLTTPDAGRVTVLGRPLDPHTPREALARGVAMVEQHFALIDDFDAVENVILGFEPTRRGVVDRAAAEAQIRAIVADLGTTLPLDVPVSALELGDRQRLEIVRALYRKAKIVILDEPTAVLTPMEASALYAVLRRLADRGAAVVVVSHKLDEVEAHADRVTVMRAGKALFSEQPGAARAELVARMTQAIMGELEPGPTAPRGEVGGAVALSLRGVTLGRALTELDLEVRSGEIVGVAGVEGNGQAELLEVLAGAVDPDSGAATPRGGGGAITVVHADRHQDGLVLDASLVDNLVLGEHAQYTRFGVLDLPRMEAAARARLSDAGASFDLQRPARTLSGGNQQKVVMARALAHAESKVLVCAHPTRGVDLGAARAIHARILGAAARGMGVLVVSADLAELRELSHRILVMRKGRVVAELPPEASEEELGRAMLGASEASS
ncbi:MAG: ATP-binding cassette domain-containing protein [Myxococcales bacterium]|nr:ATP-binding cassette domain-containing protein [Myxococcales bacterium]